MDSTGLVDIGANLSHDSFDRDRDAVLQRAWDAGLAAIVVTGSSRDSSRKALELAAAHPGRLYATAGLHPHHASDWNKDFATLIRELAAAPAVVSLGECGLDYFRNYSPHDAQRRAFIAQLQLAAELNKPLFLHQRDAHVDFVAILREHRSALGDICVHCFTDTRAALEDYLHLDCHIGITGWICDERRGQSLFELVRLIPEERLLVETDAPYLLPRTAMHTDVRVPSHGDSLRSRAAQDAQERPPKLSERRNEPAFLPYVVRRIAEARGVEAGRVGRATADNARRFFRLPAA